MEHHDLEPLRSGDFTTSRRGSALEDIDFILAKAERGVPWGAIAQMVGRPVPDIRRAVDDHQQAQRKPRASVRRAPAAPEPKRRCKAVRPRPMPPRVAEIAARIAADFGCTCADLAGSRGADAVQVARQAAYHAVRAVRRPDGRPRFSYALIGAFFGGRDHTTVLHGVRAHLARASEAQRLPRAA